MLALTWAVISAPVPLLRHLCDSGAAGAQMPRGSGLRRNSVRACTCGEIKAGSV